MRKNKQYNTSIILEHNISLDFLEILSKWLKIEKKSLLNNPSFRFINPKGESIGIDNIRDFNQELAFSNYNNQKRYFIFFNANLITIQAQNAALKSIEEPPKNTQIIFLTSTLDKLLPTIISRCKIISLKESSIQKDQFEETAKIYRKIISAYLNEGANIKYYELIELANTYKDRNTALTFFNQLLSYLNFELHSNASMYEKKQLAKHAKVVLLATEQLNQNANVKLVVENCFFEMKC